MQGRQVARAGFEHLGHLDMAAARAFGGRRRRLRPLLAGAPQIVGGLLLEATGRPLVHGPRPGFADRPSMAPRL